MCMKQTGGPNLGISARFNSSRASRPNPSVYDDTQGVVADTSLVNPHHYKYNRLTYFTVG